MTNLLDSRRCNEVRVIRHFRFTIPETPGAMRSPPITICSRLAKFKRQGFPFANSSTHPSIYSGKIDLVHPWAQWCHRNWKTFKFRQRKSQLFSGAGCRFSERVTEVLNLHFEKEDRKTAKVFQIYRRSNKNYQVDRAQISKNKLIFFKDVERQEYKLELMSPKIRMKSATSPSVLVFEFVQPVLQVSHFDKSPRGASFQ